MGCKQSNARDEADVNPNDLPAVPLQSWYAQEFDEPAAMPMTNFHAARKGRVCFSKNLIPTRREEIDGAAASANVNEVRQVTLGGEGSTLYAVGYLHDSALHIEHSWRLRPAHGLAANKFERPFYDMLIGVKLFINNMLVPDSAPHKDSLPQCTTTYRANEATTQWRAVPIVLWPEHNSPWYEGNIYPPLIYSFLSAVVTLEEGPHDLRVEVCYGCKSEVDFCTDFISRGEVKLEVTPEAAARAQATLAMIVPAVQSSESSQQVRPAVGISMQQCSSCGKVRKYICNVCGAIVCGSSECVFQEVIGYPIGCKIHMAQD